MKFKNSILFIGGTHGDEPIGNLVLGKILGSQTANFGVRSVVGNPRACEAGKRYIDADLNRSAPGNLSSLKYEERRAAELMDIFKSVDFVVDLHETKANERIVIIIPRLTSESLSLALAFEIDDIIIWPSSSPDALTGPLVQYAQSGIEIEVGTRTEFNDQVLKTESLIRKFITSGRYGVGNSIKELETNIQGRKFYLVYGKINSSETGVTELKDFEEVNRDDERYFPLLFGKHKGLIGYKMRQLKYNEILYKFLNKDIPI